MTRKGGEGYHPATQLGPRPRPWLGTPPLTPLMGLARGNQGVPERTRPWARPTMAGAFGLSESPGPPRAARLSGVSQKRLSCQAADPDRMCKGRVVVRAPGSEGRQRAQSTSYCTMRECRPSMILRLHTRNLTDQIICLWPRRLVPITKSRNSSRNFKAVDGYRNEAPVCWNCRGWQNHRA